MKKLTFCIALATILLAGCNNDKVKEFKTTHLKGEQCFEQSFDEETGWGDKTIGLKNSYDIVWPAKGMMTPEAMDELMKLCFFDSTSTSVEAAAQRWLDSIGFYDDDCKLQKVDTIDENEMFSYNLLETTCSQDSNLATIHIYTENYWAGGAHGLYSSDHVVVDVETGNIIHLTDLVTDTNLLCEAIAHAIYDLDVNAEVNECLFDEYRFVDRMPMPGNFFIDSTRSTIVVTYGLYHIACYACGIQSVVLPIFWLSKHVPLTPYAKRLFGPGSYIE